MTLYACTACSVSRKTRRIPQSDVDVERRQKNSSRLNEGVVDQICSSKSPANIIIISQQRVVAPRRIDQIHGVQDPS